MQKKINLINVERKEKIRCGKSEMEERVV